MGLFILRSQRILERALCLGVVYGVLRIHELVDSLSAKLSRTGYGLFLEKSLGSDWRATVAAA